MPHAEVKTPDQVLTEQEKQVLHLYDEQKWTLRRIGQELGVSLERARQCRRGALAKLDEVARFFESAAGLLRGVLFNPVVIVEARENFVTQLQPDVTSSAEDAFEE